MKKLAAAALLAVVAGFTAWSGSSARAAGTATPLPAMNWPFDGVFGTFDRAALQRGFQVYKEVCSACHEMRFLAYRNLAGIGYTEEQIKAIAAQYTVVDGPNDAGEMFERPAKPSDPFVRPFPNEQAARAANNGAYPPDLSLIAKARAGGPTYLAALLTGYDDPPPGVQMNAGMSYNHYFPGNQIAMPPILVEGAVAYQDGTAATPQQMAHDVASFLMWAAEPSLEERKVTGLKAILFLLVLTGFLYALKRKVWSKLH